MFCSFSLANLVIYIYMRHKKPHFFVKSFVFSQINKVYARKVCDFA